MAWVNQPPPPTSTAIAVSQPSVREKVANLLSRSDSVRTKLQGIEYSLGGQGQDAANPGKPPAPNSVDFLLMELANVIADIDDSVSRIGEHI
jgi:hypothetical protein